MLLRHSSTQHALTTSLTNPASAGDNNQRCETFIGDLQLAATDMKCVQLTASRQNMSRTFNLPNQNRNRGNMMHL